MISARVLVLAVSVAAAASLALACDPSPNASAAVAVDKGGNCATCHMPEYQRVTNPVHVNVKPAKCAVCHVQDAWRPSAVHHEFSPLVGAHQKADCTYCHGKGATAVFKGTTKECVICHRPEYDSSTFPGHASFPTTCADCHTSTAFRPATYKPPPAPAPLSNSAPLGGGKTLPLVPRPGSGSAKSSTTSRPGVAGVAVIPPPPPPPPTGRAPPPPPAPTIRPPPDVTSRSSPRRR